MSFFGDVVSGLIYRGSLPANAVSANRHRYAGQGGEQNGLRVIQLQPKGKSQHCDKTVSASYKR